MYNNKTAPLRDIITHKTKQVLETNLGISQNGKVIAKRVHNTQFKKSPDIN